MTMGECRAGGDGLIKLFGKTIPVPEPGAAAAAKNNLQQRSASSNSNGSSSTESDSLGSGTASPQAEVVDAEDPKDSPPPPAATADDAASQRERLRRPDKVLPCPRCSSMDTKFCYFNNYNVNQPRHFCKNCQRYWTAGGAMRNVPVGAGRRKNKNAAAAAASHFLHRVRAAAAALPAADALKATNGTVLSFAHAHAEQPHQAAGHRLREKLLAPARAAPPVVGPCGSEGSTNRDDNKSHHHGGDGVAEKPAVDKPASTSGAAAAAVWPPYGCAPPPAYFSSGIAIPIYPAAAPGYWGCMVPGDWSLPWPAPPPPPPPQGLSSPTSAPSVSSSGPDNSLALLGKHPREGDEGRRSGKVWAPKTIRIDDADEVARSSIWSLIGIKGDKRDDADDGGGRHNKLGGTVFEAKTAKQATISSSPLLHANPVALTRSVTFQEGS